MRLALALCLLALTLAACGAAPRDSAKEFKGEQAAVAAAVEDLESAARDNDAGETCTKLFSAGLLATIKAQGENCETAVEDAFRDADLGRPHRRPRCRSTARRPPPRVTSGTGSNKTDRNARAREGRRGLADQRSLSGTLRRAAASRRQTGAYSLIWVRRMWLPEGSRNDASMPYGISVGLVDELDAAGLQVREGGAAGRRSSRKIVPARPFAISARTCIGGLGVDHRLAGDRHEHDRDVGLAGRARR